MKVCGQMLISTEIIRRLSYSNESTVEGHGQFIQKFTRFQLRVRSKGSALIHFFVDIILKVQLNGIVVCQERLSRSNGILIVRCQCVHGNVFRKDQLKCIAWFWVHDLAQELTTVATAASSLPRLYPNNRPKQYTCIVY
jgi:hypothetical protein